MILAGEIGATNTRLAAFETENNKLQLVVEHVYPSQEQNDGLPPVIASFIKENGILPRRCRTGARRTLQDLESSVGH